MTYILGAFFGLIGRYLPGVPPIITFLVCRLLTEDDGALTAYLVHLVGRPAGDEHWVESDGWSPITRCLVIIAAVGGGLFLKLVKPFEGFGTKIIIILCVFILYKQRSMYVLPIAACLWWLTNGIPFALAGIGSAIVIIRTLTPPDIVEVSPIKIGGALLSGLVPGLSPSWVGRTIGLDLVEIFIECAALLGDSGKSVITSYLTGIQNPVAIFIPVLLSVGIPSTTANWNVRCLTFGLCSFTATLILQWRILPVLVFLAIMEVLSRHGSRSMLLIGPFLAAG